MINDKLSIVWNLWYPPYWKFCRNKFKLVSDSNQSQINLQLNKSVFVNINEWQIFQIQYEIIWFSQDMETFQIVIENQCKKKSLAVWLHKSK